MEIFNSRKAAVQTVLNGLLYILIDGMSNQFSELVIMIIVIVMVTGGRKVGWLVSQIRPSNYQNALFLLLFLSVLVSQKIWFTSLLAVFLKHGQMDFSKASNSISHHLSSIFPENCQIFGWVGWVGLVGQVGRVEWVG